MLILSKTILFEVGGANKRRKQLPGNSENQFVVKDGILAVSRQTIPLHLLDAVETAIGAIVEWKKQSTSTKLLTNRWQKI